MSAEENKEIVRGMMGALADGDWQPFFDLQADDFDFVITGHSPWSMTFSGKEHGQKELFEPLLTNFDGPYSAELGAFYAEGDTVVVEFKGHVWTKVGNLYNNEHCWVCRLEDGKLASVKEYADSLLVSRVIGAPAPQY